MRVRIAQWPGLRRAMVLVLGVLLTGCAGTPGRAGSARPRVLLASSEGAPTGTVSSGQSVQGYNVPGRKPNSQAPWEFFLGNAAHRLIAYMYKVNHPDRIAYFNNQTLRSILQDARLGEPSRLLPHEAALRPDIADLTAWSIFEIKPWNERGLQEVRDELQVYLVALNRAVAPDMNFVGGTDFSGSMLIRFAQGPWAWSLTSLETARSASSGEQSSDA